MRRVGLTVAAALTVVALVGCQPMSHKSARPASSPPSTPAASTLLSTPAASTPPAATDVASIPAAVTSASAAPTSALAPPTWQSVYANVSSGVVRIDVSNCDGGATGTGFLVAPDLVATVAHVVENMDAVRITDPVLGIATSGTVIGLSHNHDLALVRTASPIPGHIFDVATTAPAIGTEMAAIGFQLRRAMQLSVGHITGTHDHRQVGNSNWAAALSDVVLADAAVNPGNSGGPWITMAGLVVALDESGPPYDGGQRAQGNNGGVSAADAATTFAAWEQDPQTVPTGSCTLESPVDAANQTLFDYLGDITDSDYASAYAQVNPAGHPISGLDNFISGVGSSTDQATDGSGNLYQVTGTGQSDGQPYIDATFQSMQDSAHGPGGETCTVWTLRYTFSAVNGLELIDKALTTPGTAGHVAC